MEGWDQAPAFVIYGTAIGGFMFGFVRFVAKPFMRSSETTPPNSAGRLPRPRQFAKLTVGPKCKKRIGR
jgi:hypothetical protein